MASTEAFDRMRGGDRRESPPPGVSEDGVDDEALAAEYHRLWETLVRRHRDRFPRPAQMSIEDEALCMAVHSEHRERVLALARLSLAARRAAGAGPPAAGVGDAAGA